MYIQIIEGIPVASDTGMPKERLLQIVTDIKETWQWEGRQIGRLEIDRKDKEEAICIRIYGIPLVLQVPGLDKE